MESQSESNNILVKSVVAAAVVSGVAAAALYLWLKRPAVQSRMLRDRCEDALSELEHRSPSGFVHQSA
jgi:hypothetical protein